MSFFKLIHIPFLFERYLNYILAYRHLWRKRCFEI